PAPIDLPPGTGFFSGAGRVLFHTGRELYQVTFNPVSVSNLGHVPRLQAQRCNVFGYWGTAENFGGSIHLDFVKAPNGVATASVVARFDTANGLVSTLSSFTDLSDMCAFTISLERKRWIFQHHGYSDFNRFAPVGDAIGSCDALWDTPADPVWPIFA